MKNHPEVLAGPTPKPLIVFPHMFAYQLRTKMAVLDFLYRLQTCSSYSKWLFPGKPVLRDIENFLPEESNKFLWRSLFSAKNCEK